MLPPRAQASFGGGDLECAVEQRRCVVESISASPAAQSIGHEGWKPSLLAGTYLYVFFTFVRTKLLIESPYHIISQGVEIYSKVLQICEIG